tara:strand:- start:53 stop:520 length:468 start_codon:yes stop_codon:yes gene_type:complete
MLIGERLDTFSDKEKGRINDSDKKSKMNALVMKYGRSRVRKVSDESEREVKRTGKKLSWEEFKKRLEKSKEKTRLRPGEVKKWDPERQKWVSNKDEEEEMQERTMTPAEKQRDTKLKKKYEKSDTMMDNFKDQYGEKEGKSVFYAYIRKKAMEKK